MRIYPSLLLIPFISPLAAVEIRVATFNIGAHFGETFFDYSLGDQGTPDHDSVKAVLDRIDADVVALQEIHSVDLQGAPDDLDDLAASLGYPYLHQGSSTGAFDTTLRVVILSRFPFISAQNIGSPVGAKEITRLHPAVKVDVPGTANDPLIISAHLKAGTSAQEKFRRAVEMKRLVGHLTATGLGNDDNFIILGDFNPSSSSTTYSTLPAGLPGSFDLGADILLPVSYSTNLLTYFSNPAAVKLDPRQLNGSRSTFGTTFNNGPTLDLILVSPAIAGRPIAGEVYNSTLDVSNSTGLPKQGTPLADNTSTVASDHYAVFADLELDSDSPNLDLALTAAWTVEGAPDGTSAVIVTLPATKTSAVSVSVNSDDPYVATTATSIVIPAGSLVGTANIRTPRNFITEGQRGVAFTASAVGYDPDTAVLTVDDADSPYEFNAIGQILTENFNGFLGDQDPAPWVLSDSSAWQGVETGSSTIPGPRAYGTIQESSLGYLPGTSIATATATYTNQSTTPLTTLRIGLDARQWRAAFNGPLDRIAGELVVDGQITPLPGLDFTASNLLPTGQVAGGTATPISAIATGLSIPPGASFDLRISFIPGVNTVPQPTDVFINEFHYDNTGNDTGEFVEIAVGLGRVASLSALSLITYNGSNGAVVATHPLNTFTAGSITGTGYRLYHKAIGLQNESEGLAIAEGANVLQFISYEGAFAATTGPAAGMTAINIGLTQSGNDPIGLAALGLNGSGLSAADFLWRKFTDIAHSPGAVNDSQTFIIPTLPHQGLAIDNVSVEFLTDHDLDGLPEHLDPDDDNDGQSDADEIAFGSNPEDAASRFTASLSRTSAPSGGWVLSFPAAAGLNYTIQWSSTLTSWQDLSTHTGNGQVATVPLPNLGPSVFFRIRSGS
jgi:endonuclease/exonuclease/phosphatase family metal-dependent hydrolase